MKLSKRILFFIIALLAILMVFSGCSLIFGAATLSDAVMTDSIDAQGQPGEAVTAFSADTPLLFCSAMLNHAPGRTQVRMVWTFVTGNEQVYEVLMDSISVKARIGISDRRISSYFEPAALLQEGEYRVDYFLKDHEEPDATVSFQVGPAQNSDPAENDDAAIINDAHMTTFIDKSGIPADTIEIVPITGIWYVCATLSNTQPDTMVNFVWYRVDGSVMDTSVLDPHSVSDVSVFCSFDLSGSAQEGRYWVGIFANGVEVPTAVVTFTAAKNAE